MKVSRFSLLIGASNVTVCPFCSLPTERLVLEGALALAVRDGYPVSPGHTLVIPRRHVGSWFEASAEEQRELLALVARVKEQLDAELRPDGYNIGINVGEAAGQTVMHLHVHVIPRFLGDVDDPRGGVRFVIPSAGNYQRPGHVPQRARRGAPLATGGNEDPFLAHILPLLRGAREIAILAAFVQGSGVDRLSEELDAALRRGARVRVLTGDYLNITQARALRGLLDLARGRQAELGEPAVSPEGGPAAVAPGAELDLRVVEIERLVREGLGTTFHPKAWIFVEDDAGAAFVGSSNLSAAALGSGVEWNLRVERALDPEAFAAVLERYERWWSRGRAVDEAWLDGYSERARAVAHELPAGELEVEPLAPLPPLWDVQEEALDALHDTREAGHERALVVLATGLGKTVLAARDVDRFREEHGRMPRVLFLAHRVEILRQAASTFRRQFPDTRFGWYVGASDELTGDTVFASVMKLGRPANLATVPPGTFDYVIVDEVHHADARTYRRILGHLRPHFLLGLTATPERADTGDILGLFDDNLAYRADLGRGVVDGHLVPFHYFGLADTIDYAPANIPWRNRRFDPEALARAAQTATRMERLHRGWLEHPGARTLVFCCSIAHAEYTRSWLAERSIAVAAVHSGPGSADREASIARLTTGELAALCTVDLFNEGVDIPTVDRVVMLRPTESPVVFLQQLGRGLRLDPAHGKQALTVIDFVGNHRVFLDRVRTLLSLAPRGSDATGVRELLEGDTPALPPGCSVDLELEAKDLLRRFLAEAAGDALVRKYRELRGSRGHRPRIGELYRLGYNPRALRQHESWFELVADEGDLSSDEHAALDACGELLADIERRETMTKSFKMVALQALLEADAVAGGMSSRENAERSHAILHRSPELLRDLGEEWRRPTAELDLDAWQRYWEEWPLGRWAGTDRKGRAWFRLEDDRFTTRFAVPDEARDALSAMLEELVDYRLAQYRRRAAEASADEERGGRAFVCKLIHAGDRPILRLPGRERFPGIPTGETDVALPDGRIWRFRLAKEYCNVAHPVGSQRNQLPDLCRGWFGIDAGMPGTAYEVRFTPGPDGWRVEPLHSEGAQIIPFPRRGLVRSYPTVRAAAGWSSAAQVEEAIEADAVRLPGEHDPEATFALRASGHSMEGLRSDIRDGDWLILRLARGRELGAVLGRVALVAHGHPEEGRSFHLKRIARRGPGFELVSDNPDVPAVAASADDELLALLERTVRPEALGPEVGALLDDGALATAFELVTAPTAPAGRVDGHLFVLAEGEGKLIESDRVAVPVADRREAETAFVLARRAAGDPWRYLGVGRWVVDENAWAITDVDFETWRELGHGRTASRRLEKRWLDAAREDVSRLLANPGPGGWVEADGKRCRLVGPAARGGLRVDGGQGGFGERTVSELDLAWVLKARALAAVAGRAADEALVNELRYLDGTPKGSTRYIDNGWALALTAGTMVARR